MNILITGVNGFIGSHVSKYFLEKGYYVIGLGRHKESLVEVDEYIPCDLSTDEVKGIYNKMKVKHIDAIIHLAVRYEPYAIEMVLDNCGSTQRLLELCEENKIKCFIQLSSLPLIGKPEEHPITEEHPVKPSSIYYVTKRTQELLANCANYTLGLRTVSFRISAPVGIGMNPKSIVPTFVRLAMNNENLILSGKGTRKQTYIHVDDICQAILRAINSSAQGVYNLSSNNFLSNKELAMKCIEVIGSKSQICFNGKRDELDDYIWDVSLDKIHKDMGYVPEIDMEHAVLELYTYFKGKKNE